MSAETTPGDAWEPAAPPANDPQLKPVTVGISLVSDHVSSWEYEAIERIRSMRWITVAFVLYTRMDRSTRSSPDLLTRWYLSFDTRQSHPKPDALAPKKVTPLVGDLIRIELDETSEISDIPEVDVITHFGSSSFPRQLAGRTRHGVWYFPERNHGWKHGLAETLRRQEVVTAELCALLPSGETVIIDKSHGSAGDQSPGRVRNPSLWKSSMFPVRQLFRMALGTDRPNPVEARPNGSLPRSSAGPALVVKHAASMLTSKVPRKFYLDQWHILYKFHDGEAHTIGLDGFSTMLPPKDRFWADPFVLHRDGKYFVFLEESLMKPRKKGFISVTEVKEDGTHGEPVKILEQPYHLSYPFLFEHRGELFMIPESGQNGTIDLYRCEEFPFRWKHHKTLMHGVQAVDSTLLFHEGRWWMFANMIPRPGVSLWDELYLFWTNDPIDGRWMPHPLNPVVSDARRSRPAGSLWRAGSVLYRPSQDCGKRYGYALNINEVIRLNTLEYQERVFHRVEPPPSSPLEAVHTLNRSGRLTVMDGIQHRARFV